jgi:hypothetical protein
MKKCRPRNRVKWRIKYGTPILATASRSAAKYTKRCRANTIPLRAIMTPLRAKKIFPHLLQYPDQTTPRHVRVTGLKITCHKRSSTRARGIKISFLTKYILSKIYSSIKKNITRSSGAVPGVGLIKAYLGTRNTGPVTRWVNAYVGQPTMCGIISNKTM